MQSLLQIHFWTNRAKLFREQYEDITDANQIMIEYDGKHHKTPLAIHFLIILANYVCEEKHVLKTDCATQIELQ